MRWEVVGRPSYSLLVVQLHPGESVTAAAGAFVYGRGDYEVETHAGGVAAALKRKLFGGGSFFLNTFAARGQAEVGLAPPLPGDIAAVELDGSGYAVQDSAFLAYAGDVEVDAVWRGLKGWLAGRELFWLRARGRGTLWVSAYGHISAVEVPPGGALVVDAEHLVALPLDADYRIRKFGGWKSFLLGGEGLVVEVKGPATVYVQSRRLAPLVELVARAIKARK